MAVDSKQIAKQVADFDKQMKDSAKTVKQSTESINKLENAFKDVFREHTNTATAVKKLLTEIASWSSTIQYSIDTIKDYANQAKGLTGDVEMIGRRYDDDLRALQTMSEDFIEIDTQFKKDKSNKDLAKKHEIAEKAYIKASNNAAKTQKDWTVVEGILHSLSEREMQLNLKNIESLGKELSALSDAIMGGPKITALLSNCKPR